MLATVLSEGAAGDDPIAEAARSLLDGHIGLSIERANAGAFPAIDLGQSASRTMDAVIAGPHLESARLVRAAIARLNATRDARELGLARPADAFLERAVAAEAAIERFMTRCGASPPEDTIGELRKVAALLE